MKWRDQQKEVEKIAAQVQADANAIATHRRALRTWSRQTFGNAEGLAWSFAAGAVWGLAREPGAENGKVRRTAGAAAKASLFAWRVANLPAP